MSNLAAATGLHIFTAPEFARKLGSSPQYVRKVLKATPPSGEKLPRRMGESGESIVSQKPAAGWALGSIPFSLENRIASLAKKESFSSSLEFMLSRPAQELPSLAGVSDHDIHYAEKLRRALAPASALPAGTSVSERSRVAAPHYAREFGTAVTDRYLRELICRTLQRDGERGNFADLRLYLPPPRKRSRRLATRAAFQFRELDAQLNEISHANPTAADISAAWRKITTFFREKVDFGAPRAAARLKKALRCYLIDRAPFIAKTEAALARNLDRKLRDREELGVSGTCDGRIAPAKRESARDLLAEFTADLCLLRDYAAEYCSGKISPAYRELHVGSSRYKQQFSEAFRRAFPFDPRRKKSQVPAVIRWAVSPKVRLALPGILGPTALRNARAKRHLDWSKVASGDWYSGDDVTGNHYIYEFRLDGKWECARGRFNVGRPQWLPTIDEKTQCPLGASVRLAKQYDALMILAGTSRVCLDPTIGLPMRGFNFEKGRYASKIVEGLVSWTEIDEAFAREGIDLKIHHAQGPTGKSRIENAIGRMQAMFDFGPGYVGRDERHVRFERVQKFVARLKKIDQPNKPPLDPGEELMSLAEYEAELAIAIGRFAEEPQNGEILRDGHGCGLSPKKAWSYFTSGRPHKVLPPSLSFLLSTHPLKPQRVTSDGIRVTINGCNYYYCDQALLNLFRGERVLVRLNPDFPDQVVVAHAASDPHGREAIAVPVRERIPAKDATREDFRRSSITDDHFFSLGKTYHRVFAPDSNLTIARENLGSAELRAGGETYNRIEREHIELRQERASHEGAIHRLAAGLGRQIEPRRNPPRAREKLEAAANLREELREMEQAGAADSQQEQTEGTEVTGKTYVLEAPAKPLTQQQRNGMYWRLWKVVEAAKPGLNRFAITSRVLGRVKKIAEMTDEEFLKVCHAFESIAKS